MNAYQRRKERRNVKRYAAHIQKIVDGLPKAVDLLSKSMQDCINLLPPGLYTIYPKG